MHRLVNRSRMSGDVHVRFCECLRGWFPRATRLVILCKGKIDAPIQMVKMVLDRCELRLNDQKTKIINAYQDSFDFLGFRFQMRRSPRSGKWYPHTEPSKRSEERIKATVKRLTHRRRTPVSVPDLIDEINYATQGWVSLLSLPAQHESDGSGQMVYRRKGP